MLAVELDRVQADVHQHLHTVWARDTDRVLRVEHRRHSARDGGDELAVSRADSDPLAEDLSREDGIVDLGERDDLTGEGALQLDAGGGGLCRVARVGDRTGEAKRSVAEAESRQRMSEVTNDTPKAMTTPMRALTMFIGFSAFTNIEMLARPGPTATKALTCVRPM